MSYAKLIAAIRGTGLTQAEIGHRIKRSQSVISDIERGRTTDLRKSTADAIERLHAEVVGGKGKRRRVRSVKPAA